jgi:hypothetical protein
MGRRALAEFVVVGQFVPHRIPMLALWGISASTGRESEQTLKIKSCVRLWHFMGDWIGTLSGSALYIISALYIESAAGPVGNDVAREAPRRLLRASHA